MSKTKTKSQSQSDRHLFFRTATIESAPDADSRVVEVVFATETPVERWFGMEILACDEQCVRLDRLRAGSPLLLNHDTRQQIGVVERAWVQDGVCRATVRFGRSQLAEEILQDVRDGIRRLVSVGYVVHAMEVTKSKGAGPDTCRANDWEPHEVSLVPVPADINAGVGRTLEEMQVRVLTINTETADIMETNDNPTIQVNDNQTPAPPATDRSKEAHRIREIGALGVRFGLQREAEDAIRSGADLSDFQQKVIVTKFDARPIDLRKPAIDVPDRDAARYSLVRAINRAASGKALDGIEGEINEECGKQYGRQASGFWLPTNVRLGESRRDLIAGTAEYGANTVATELMADRFIDTLENALMVRQLGATVLNGLRGNVAIPRASAGATAYWVSEIGAGSESTPTFDQVPLTPKGVSAWVEYSKLLLNQSSINVEQFVRQEIARRLATAIDAAAIDGSGESSQPTGVLRTSGIGSYALGSSGAAPTWAMVVGLETDCAVGNAPWQNMAYLTNPLVRGTLKITPKQSSGVEGNFIWSDQAFPGQPQYGMVNSYKAAATNQVPSNKTKSGGQNLSCMAFGNWAELILGQWDGIDVVVDPYTRAKEALVLIVARMWVDVAVQHPASFSACLDIVTS